MSDISFEFDKEEESKGNCDLFSNFVLQVVKVVPPVHSFVFRYGLIGGCIHKSKA